MGSKNPLKIKPLSKNYAILEKKLEWSELLLSRNKNVSFYVHVKTKNSDLKR